MNAPPKSWDRLLCQRSRAEAVSQHLRESLVRTGYPEEYAMVTDRAVLVCLAVWALLFGLFHVTNLTVVWGPYLMGFAALACGVVCLLRAFGGGRAP